LLNSIVNIKGIGIVML